LLAAVSREDDWHGRRRFADGTDATAARTEPRVLAAGRSTRMGAVNKMLAEIGGKPLVRIAAEQALASRAAPVIVVTGHEREKVEAALAGLAVRFTHNPDYADGLGASLKAGIAAVPADADAAIVCLGDMPQVDSQLIDRLIAAFDPERGGLVVVPSINGRRGNPVVWSRRFFNDLMSIPATSAPAT
jgi:molybdenum cofactor cytidylyltransferase